MCDMTPSYVWHDSFICVTWFIHMCDKTHSYVTWLIHMCDTTHSYVWHNSFIYVTWLIRICDMTQVARSENINMYLCMCVCTYVCTRTSVHIYLTYLLGGVVWSRCNKHCNTLQHSSVVKAGGKKRGLMRFYAYVCVCMHMHICLYIFMWRTCWGE